MLIAYMPVFQTEKKEHDTQPELFVGQAGNFMVVLRTSDFEVQYKDGKAEVSLARYMTNEELKAFATKLLDAADNSIRDEKQFVIMSSELLVSADETCPTCDGSGTFPGK